MKLSNISQAAALAKKLTALRQARSEFGNTNICNVVFQVGSKEVWRLSHDDARSLGHQALSDEAETLVEQLRALGVEA